MSFFSSVAEVVWSGLCAVGRAVKSLVVKAPVVEQPKPANILDDMLTPRPPEVAGSWVRTALQKDVQSLVVTQFPKLVDDNISAFGVAYRTFKRGTAYSTNLEVEYKASKLLGAEAMVGINAYMREVLENVQSRIITEPPRGLRGTLRSVEGELKRWLSSGDVVKMLDEAQRFIKKAS